MLPIERSPETFSAKLLKVNKLLLVSRSDSGYLPVIRKNVGSYDRFMI